MANARTLLGYEYLAAEDLGGKDVTLTIKTVTREDIPQPPAYQDTKTKAVIHFKEVPRKMVCNKTNGSTIIHLYGNETDEWIGKRITLYAVRGKFFGKDQPAIRIRQKVPA